MSPVVEARIFKLLIGGELIDGSRQSPVINPANEQPVALCGRASEEQLNAAVAAAKAAHAIWEATPLSVRASALISAAEVIEAHADEIGALLTAEQGKPLATAIQEARTLALGFKVAAHLRLDEEVLEDSAARHVVLRRRSLGVVAAIIPWNFPLSLLAFKVPPALLAGNTVVTKPAATTPLSTLRVAELIKDVFPPGVINVIVDEDDLGSRLTAHPGVAKVSFTGSTATGRKVMANAADTLKRLTLELGGNDAAIVLPDVDVKHVASHIFDQAFRNSGQLCIAAKRIYVHAEIYEDFCAEMAVHAEAVVVGDGRDERTTIGPLQNRAQFERVKALLERAATEGKVVAGGQVLDRRGFFIRPTIIRDIRDGTELVDNEQFGPILPIIIFDDIDEVLSRVNASDYGLGGSIWTNDRELAERLARKIEAGTVWINKHAELVPTAPFGGAKMSGLGMEIGRYGLEEFTQIQVINAPPLESGEET